MSAEEFGVTSRNREMLRLVTYAVDVAVTPYPVLLLGETGTGKELFARGIHRASRRSGYFVPVNCGAIPETLFEAELFGARRGAYTGIDHDREGMFARADRGTLFLDEIAEMPLAVQVKLLRVLQDGHIRPLGATEHRSVEVRVVAATHKDLPALVQSERFRMDLYFRISAATIHIPPLRKRVEDIEPLIRRAVNEASQVQSLTPLEIEPEIIELAKQYSWPGNVRELQHAVARAVLDSRGDRLNVHAFRKLTSLAPHDSGAPRRLTDKPFVAAVEEFEKAYLAELLERVDHNISHAAALAEIPRSTLRDKVRKYDLAAMGSSRRGRPPGASAARKPTE